VSALVSTIRLLSSKTVSEPSDVYNVTYFPNHEGQVQAVQFTHENLTAGVASTRALVPATNPLSTLDTVVSAFSLSHPFGRAVAYTAIYEGTNFATLDSSKLFRPDDTMICKCRASYTNYLAYCIHNSP